MLNGKATDGNDFGRKVEFAMDLVSYRIQKNKRWLLTATGSYYVPNRVRSNQRTEYEDDRPISCGKRIEDKCECLFQAAIDGFFLIKIIAYSILIVRRL